MLYHPSNALRLSLVISLVGYVVADIQQFQFQWQFRDSSIASFVPTCATLPIVVKPFNLSQPITNRTAPYYMIAFAIGGTPITSPIGSDESNLNWTVTHPVGSKLLLTIADANGNPGGVPPQFFTVMPGQTTQCVVNPPSAPTFEVTSNVTGDLQTCQPWGIRIKGGVPPYNITLAELNQPVVTNVTIPNGLDAFTFINRAEPGSQLIAAISDFNGSWAHGTVVVNTKGAIVTDSSCTGLVSSSGNATLLDAADAAAVAAIQSAIQRKKTATGVAVTLTLLLVLGLAALGVFYMRKRKRQAEIESAETKAHQFTEPESQMLSITNYLASGPSMDVKGSLNSVSSNPLFPNATSLEPAPSYVASNPNIPRSKMDVLGIGNPSPPPPRRPTSRASNSGFANFPATSIRRSAKAMEAAATVVQNPSPDSEYPQDGLSSSSTRVSQVETLNGSRVLQHRDAGSVRELPPPYADRTRFSNPSSS